MGNKLVKWDNNFKFMCEVPNPGMRYELNKMVIADKVEVLAKKRGVSKEELKRGKSDFKWPENVPS